MGKHGWTVVMAQAGILHDQRWLSPPTRPHPVPNALLQTDGYKYLFHPRQFRRSSRASNIRFRSGAPRHSAILDAEERLYTTDAEAKRSELLEIDQKARQQALDEQECIRQSVLSKQRELEAAEAQIRQNEVDVFAREVEQKLELAQAQERHVQEAVQLQAELEQTANDLQRQDIQAHMITDRLIDWEQSQFYRMPYRASFEPFPSVQYRMTKRPELHQSVLHTCAHIH